jgi:hypothetical protein
VLLNAVKSACLLRRNPNKKPVIIMKENIIDEGLVRSNNLEYSQMLKTSPSDVPRLVAHVPGCINIITSCYDMRLILKIIADMHQTERCEERDLDVMFGDFFIRSCCGTYDVLNKKVRVFSISYFFYIKNIQKLNLFVYCIMCSMLGTTM